MTATPPPTAGEQLPVTVTTLDHGPLQVEGTLRIVDPDGTTYDLGERQPVYLCRCGGSANKPFCDGSHARVGFTADERAGGAGSEQCLH